MSCPQREQLCKMSLGLSHDFNPVHSSDMPVWWICHVGCSGVGLAANLLQPLWSEQSKCLCCYMTANTGCTEVFGEKGCIYQKQFQKCLCLQQTQEVKSGLFFCTNNTDCRVAELVGPNGLFKNECAFKEFCCEGEQMCKIGEVVGEYSFCMSNRKCLCLQTADAILPKAMFIEFCGVRLCGPPKGASGEKKFFVSFQKHSRVSY